MELKKEHCVNGPPTGEQLVDGERSTMNGPKDTDAVLVKFTNNHVDDSGRPTRLPTSKIPGCLSYHGNSLARFASSSNPATW